MNIVVFEDDGVERLYPVTTGKPAYAITCAGFRLIDWLSEIEGRHRGAVRPHLESIQQYDFPGWNDSIDVDVPLTWLINARVVPTLSNVQRLKAFQERQASRIIAGQRQVYVVRSGDAIASVLLPTDQYGSDDDESLAEKFARWVNDSDENLIEDNSQIDLFQYPHEVIDHNMRGFDENLEHRIDIGSFQETDDHVFLADNVDVGQHVVFDTRCGPIVIDENVKLGPFSYFCGPIYIGPNCKVSEHASIKDKVAVSHTCKIGGEIEASVIEPFTNKQHHGFLGHSYLGSWINLGAGTCNSDLKNTYGMVNVRYGSEKNITGMQFLGCVMGDYAKTAINTSIFTGKIIGTASMAYGVVTTNVPSFVNYARSFNEVGILPPEVIVSTQKRMFARRNKEQRECDICLIQDMFRLTEQERPADLSSEPIKL